MRRTFTVPESYRYIDIHGWPSGWFRWESRIVSWNDEILDESGSIATSSKILNAKQYLSVSITKPGLGNNYSVNFEISSTKQNNSKTSRRTTEKPRLFDPGAYMTILYKISTGWLFNTLFFRSITKSITTVERLPKYEMITVSFETSLTSNLTIYSSTIISSWNTNNTGIRQTSFQTWGLYSSSSSSNFYYVFYAYDNIATGTHEYRMGEYFNRTVTSYKTYFSLTENDKSYVVNFASLGRINTQERAYTDYDYYNLNI